MRPGSQDESLGAETAPHRRMSANRAALPNLRRRETAQELQEAHDQGVSCKFTAEGARPGVRAQEAENGEGGLNAKLASRGKSSLYAHIPSGAGA